MKTYSQLTFLEFKKKPFVKSETYFFSNPKSFKSILKILHEYKWRVDVQYFRHNSLCPAILYVRWQHSTARIRRPLLHAAIDRSATDRAAAAGRRRTLQQRADGTDRRVPFHRPCCAYYAGSANNTR